MSDGNIMFKTHVDEKGKLKEGKEAYECPECTGFAYITEAIATPKGNQVINFCCTECGHEWSEAY